MFGRFGCKGSSVCFAAFLVLCGCGGGGSSAPAVPGAPPAPGSALASALASIDVILQAQVDQGYVPGIALGIARNGGIIITKAYGTRSLSPPVAADVATAFQVGSITKQFTAACILELVESGKVRLDEPLSDFIPEYAHAGQVTIRQILNMVSGIPADPSAAFTTLYGSIDHESVVQRLNGFPLDFQPGSRYEYSNQGYYLLGLVIERASGEHYDRFLSDRILGPLGLSQSAYLADETASDIATGYSHNNDPKNPFAMHPSWSSDYLYSFGALVSSSGDILRWHAALLAGRVISSSSLQTMFTVPQLPAGAVTYYGMGWFVEPTGERWHDGETGGFHSATSVTSDGYDVVILGNAWDQYAGAFSPTNLVQEIHSLLPQ